MEAEWQMVTRPIEIGAPVQTGNGSLAVLFARVMDLSVCLLLLPLLAPIWLLAALLAWREGHAWTTRRQLLGRAARPFAFREALPLRGFGKTLFNHRILRLSPRLLAVLSGRAALVGPAPLTPAQAETLTAAQRVRFTVAPGLVHRYFLRRSVNIAFTDEAQLALEDAVVSSLPKRAAMLLRGLIALLLDSEQAPQAAARLRMFGLTLTNETRDQAVSRILTMAQGEQPGLVAFVNPACVNIAMEDASYRAVLERAAVIFPDGIGIKLAARYLGQSVIDNLNGTDLFPALCDRLEGTGLGLYLLGAQPGVVEVMVERMRERWPALDIRGWHHGHLRDRAEEDRVIEQVAASGAAVLLVAMGVPAQERFIDRTLPRLGVKVALGVGGLFDFTSGRIPRAPLWLRELGLEWAYRLLREPRRLWRRYVLGNFVFLWHLARYHRERQG